MSSFRPHQTGNYGPPKHAMTKSVNYSPHAPSHLFEAEDPLQVIVSQLIGNKHNDPSKLDPVWA